MVWSTAAPAGLRRVSRRRYRNGSSGDQRRALGTGTVKSLKPPVAEPTTVVPSSASARTLYPLTPPRAETRTRKVLAVMFGDRSARLIDEAGVGSSHTVCQMPEVGV